MILTIQVNEVIMKVGNVMKKKVLFISSTGAHTVVSMCLIRKTFGSKIIFIETFANSKTKSKTGSIVYKFADIFIVQWKDMLELYFNAVYGGGFSNDCYLNICS